MNKDTCDRILSFMQSQANGRINIPVRTRSIADAAGLTIYQARAYLVTLEDAGVVEKTNSGKGVPGLWCLV
ncbi:FaeA/PapI family transcriptional regulator [Salmonella enterica]|uniref:FaeA/PapI family transcriptional regulator n=1 Tax=Salmonella enterica TaxID=28901 RepID=UPI000FA9C2C8|nr:FaeA/PapI family transcriptional regulator [Salmonella enterica]ECG7009926.1 faeA-like family protein [Salmonella enterica subsp. enterica]EDZ5417304.1 faeA-like family protein [Salmonella enterica subsp. enterica serovar Muenchen]EGI5701982.1 faeA-like family protein [Salmonella enterica subsp. enterica serovar Chester]HEC7539701.1 faeA-like family protein [Salmonella enterica subsp. enterica serovar Oranienburg]EAZ4459968.1 faeA-like family protein [Salmonella enterica]